MNLVVQISGDRESVGAFLSFLKTDDKYLFYTNADFLFSPTENTVKLTYQRSYQDKGEGDGQRMDVCHL